MAASFEKQGRGEKRLPEWSTLPDVEERDQSSQQPLQLRFSSLYLSLVTKTQEENGSPS